MAGLREVKRLSTMRRVQTAALDLFEARGFDAVSVAEFASAAEVSERTVYRLFGTKEGVLLWVEADDEFLQAVIAALPSNSLIDAARLAARGVDEAFTPEQRAHAARVSALVAATPSASAALATGVWESARRLGVALALARGLGEDDDVAHLEAVALTSVLAHALTRWERAGAQGPLSEALLGALDTLQGLATR